MIFCSACGQSVHSAVPQGDNRPRFVCASCGTVHYENPKLVVGCVPEYQGRILLCRRAIEPRHGFWTVPAGFMEIGETLAEAAIRETREEALAEVELGELFALVDVLQAAQVHAFFRARLPAPEFGAGAETLECRLVTPAEIPWDELAFPSIRIALETWLAQPAGAPVQLTTAPRRRLG